MNTSTTIVMKRVVVDGREVWIPHLIVTMESAR